VDFTNKELALIVKKNMIEDTYSTIKTTIMLQL